VFVKSIGTLQHTWGQCVSEIGIKRLNFSVIWLLISRQFKRLTPTIAYLVLPLIYAAGAVAIYVIWLAKGGVNFQPQFDAYLAGSAPNPYAQRVLIPWTVNIIQALLPSEAKSALAGLLSTRLSIGVGHILGVPFGLYTPEELLSQYVIAVILTYLSLVLFLFTFRKLLYYFFNLNQLWYVIAPVICLAVLQPLFRYAYWTDFPSLFLGGALSLAVLRRRYLMSLVIFTAMTLNRETSILFIPVVFCLLIKTRNWWRLPVALLVAYVTIRIPIMLAYGGNGGEWMEYQLGVNLRRFYLETPYEFTEIAIIGIIVATLFYKWTSKSGEARILAIAPGLLLALMLFGGRLGEFRILYEGMSALLVLAVDTVFVEWIKLGTRRNPGLACRK
jgi:hypothetical protein